MIWFFPLQWLIIWWIVRGLCVAIALMGWAGMLTADNLHQAWLYFLWSIPGDVLIGRWAVDRGIAIRRRMRVR